MASNGFIDVTEVRVKVRNLTVVAVALLASACASQPDKIQTAYVSPMKYAGYDCQQVVMEMDHIGRRTTELHMALQTKANNDGAQMAIGMLLFWPALFFLEGGDGPEAAEYARLKGEHEALRQTAVQNKCDTAALPPSPEELIKAEQERQAAVKKGSAVQ